MRALRPGIRSLTIAPALALAATRLSIVPVHADLLPSPSPLALPTITTSSAPLPLPSLTPLPLPTIQPSLPTIIGGSGPSPTPTAVSGVSTGGSGAGGTAVTGTGGGSTGGSSSGGSHGGPASGGHSSGSQASSADPPAGGGLGPLPAFPGLPRGTVQTVTWILVLLVPLMLAVWVFVLIRALSRLRVLRSPATLIAAASDLGLSPREIVSLSPSALERLRDQLALDELTGCMRRATGISALEREVVRARRERSALSIAFIDADGLKHANDTLGHAAGDQLLKDVVEGLKSRLRGSDFVFRYGGDEFVCVLPGATAASSSDVLTDVQNQLRARGRSFSLGIAEAGQEDDAVSLLGRADENLYAAKRALKEGRPQPGLPVRVLPEGRVS